MQSTSTAWKQTLGCYDYADRPNIVPVSEVEVKYTINDPAAQIDAEASDNGHVGYSDTEHITDGQDKIFARWPTFEHNMWFLDGTWKIKHGTYTEDTGFVSSALSGENCLFTANPVITISFDSTYTTNIPGITITWSKSYNEMARDFTVRIFNGITLVETLNVTDNTNIVSVIESDITGYNKIEVEIVAWCLPIHRARIEEIVIGVVKVYDKSTLMGFEHNQNADLLSLELPDYSVVFNISNVDGAWNPDNPQGMVKYLIERQEISVRYGYKIGSSMEWIKAGAFYMSEWDTPSNGITANFEARSLIDFMSEKYTVSTTTITLSALATSALTQSNLPTNADGTNKWNIDSTLESITVTLPEEFDHTCAEVLQLCANASCCVLYIDRNGNIIITPLVNTLTDYIIDQFVSYQNAEYSLSKPLKSVDVNDGLGTVANSTNGDVQTISNELIQSSTVANAVATWVKNILAGRKTLSGEYRPDPRLDALDKIITENKYATNTVFITNVKYKYGGAFSGSYEGRVVV